MKNYKIQIVLIALIIISSIIIIGTVLISKSGLVSDFKNRADSGSVHSSLEAGTEPGSPLVIIDPGHGGWEPGAGNGPVNEKDVVLDISLEIEKYLIEKKINYYLIRNDDTYYSLEDRAKIANEKKASLFISIHNNSFTDSSQSGILTAYNPYSSVGKEIARIMQSKLSDLGMKDRDISSRPNLYVLRHTEMPSLLLEIGFISSNKDFKLITDPDFQKKCAKQVVSGIEDILAELDSLDDEPNN